VKLAGGGLEMSNNRTYAKRRGYMHTSEGSREAKDGVLRADNPKIEVPLAKLFS